MSRRNHSDLIKNLVQKKNQPIYDSVLTKGISEKAQLTNLMEKRKQVEHKSSWKGPEESFAQEHETQTRSFHLKYQILQLCHQDESEMVYKWQVLSVLRSVERCNQFPKTIYITISDLELPNTTY